MTKVSSDLLNDTLNLVQLARETALVRGNKAQADRFSPVADNLQEIVKTNRQSQGTDLNIGVMGQSDFKALLSAAQSAPRPVVQASSASDRNQIVVSMSSAGMADVDIARHMGITRDEVRLILNIGQSQQPTGQVFK